MSNNQKINISKIDAAKRQLETAIQLWVASDDPVSIHTLAAAALRILYDLAKERGVAATLYDLPGVYEHKKQELRKLLKRDGNFFKHADADPTATLDFNPDAAEIFILEAVCMYEKLSSKIHVPFSCFKAWMFINNPELIEDRSRQAATEVIEANGINVHGMSRSEFFERWMQAMAATGLSKNHVLV